MTSLNYCYWLRNFSALEQSVVPNISIHNVHLNGLQCGFASVFMWSDFEKLLSNFEPLKVFSSVWVLSCSFKELGLEKHLSRFVHLNGFSPVSLSNLMVRSSCHTLGTWMESLLSGTHMFLQVASYWETLVTLCAVKRLLFCVDPFMLLQGTWSWKILVTLCALEWNLSWVVPICSFKWPVIVKLLSHFEQLKGFSSV